MQYLELDDTYLWNDGKIMEAADRKITECDRVRAELEKEHNLLEREWKKLTSGEILELPKDFQELLTRLELHPVYGMNWLEKNGVTVHETVGMFAGAMTSTPGYGTALDASDAIDYKIMYNEGENEQKEEMLNVIDSSGELTVENTAELSTEQANTYKEAMASKVSLGYTVAFPMGVLVIVILISLLPRIFRIDVEKERAEYEKEMKQIEALDTGKSLFFSHYSPETVEWFMSIV